MRSHVEIDSVALGVVHHALERLVDDMRAMLRRSEALYAQIHTITLDARVPIQREPQVVSPTPTGSHLWRIDEVKKRVALSRSTIWRLVKDSEFPEPRRLTGHRLQVAIKHLAPLAPILHRRRGIEHERHRPHGASQRQPKYSDRPWRWTRSRRVFSVSIIEAETSKVPESSRSDVSLESC